jgi:hypothetical protein
MTASSNRLPILQDEIRIAHRDARDAAKTAVDRARDAGVRLIEAKGLLGHGEWLPWLKETGVSPRTAQRYMQLAQIPADKYDTVAHLGIKSALEAIAKVRAKPFRLPAAGEAAHAQVGNLSAMVWQFENTEFFKVATFEDLSGLGPEESSQDIGIARIATIVSEKGPAATVTVFRKPIAGDHVEYALAAAGFPDSASWEIVSIGREELRDLASSLEGGA